MADKLNGIFIAELLADNAGGSAIDTDGDGNTNKSDEFIQLQSTSGTPVSLDGFELWSEKNGQLFSFGPGDTIGAGGTATVVGNYNGTPPAGFFDGGVSEGTNWIPDGEGQKFDTIFLVDTNTGDYITLSYGNPPRTPTLPSGFPGTTQVGSGETIDSNAPNGRAFARDANGDLIETTPTPGAPDVPCFVKGTHITTEHGVVAIEDLKPGMRVKSKDNGWVRLRGIGRFFVSPLEALQTPNLAPVVFPKSSIGNSREMRLSGAHRVLVAGEVIELLFSTPEALVSARSQVGLNGIRVSPVPRGVTYYHLLFDRHEIIHAEGTWVESLFLADLAREVLKRDTAWVFQDGYDATSAHHAQTVRIVLRHAEAQLWQMARFRRNAPQRKPSNFRTPGRMIHLHRPARARHH